MKAGDLYKEEIYIRTATGFEREHILWRIINIEDRLVTCRLAEPCKMLEGLDKKVFHSEHMPFNNLIAK